MKQPKILFLVVIALLPLILVSCVSSGTQLARGWSGTAFDDGIIYAGTLDGKVVAVNSSSQGVLWSYAVTTTTSSGMSCGPTSAPTAIYTTPIVDGDLVYVGTYSGKVLTLNTTARSQDLPFPQTRYGEWKWDCPLENAKSNAIVADLLVIEDAIYVSSSNGRVYSLDKEFGDLNWESEILDQKHRKLWKSPVLQGNTLYVSTFDGHIYALSVETGELLDWSFESEAGFASSPVIYEDTIYMGSFDRHLYAIGIGSNISSMWKFPQEKPAGNWFWASPIVNEGIVYAGCLDGKLYAIESETGEKSWEFDAGSSVVSPPVLTDNLLIVVNESGTVYVFDLGAKIGDEAVPLKTISIGADVRSPFCAQGGLVYIRGEDKDNHLFVVDIDKGELSWKISLTIEE
jgi:outer membrane protein assembly factor BamB